MNLQNIRHEKYLRQKKPCFTFSMWNIIMWYFSIEIAIDVRVLLGSAHIEQHNIISCCLDFDVSTYITLSFGTDFILFLAKKISFDKKNSLLLFLFTQSLPQHGSRQHDKWCWRDLVMLAVSCLCLLISLHIRSMRETICDAPPAS